MIDLTKHKLEELQEKITKSCNGSKVRIYSNDGGGRYPIHGAEIANSVWHSNAWDKEGVDNTKKFNLDLSNLLPKTIDFRELPKDTLIKTEYGLRYVTNNQNNLNSNSVRIYERGTTSDSYVSTISVKQEYCSLVKGRVEPWFGETECPLPEGVEVNVWFRGGENYFTETKDCSEFNWQHKYLFGDIIFYQITGNIINENR